MLGKAVPVAFIPSGDLDRSRHFYEHQLGLRCIAQDSFACVFDVNGVPLRVTLVPEPPALPFTVFGWQVTDVATTVATLAARGVEFARFDGMDQDAHGLWRAPGGALVAWFHDPDRNLLSVSENA